MAGTIYLVGTGPGKPALITPEARSAIKIAQVLIGHEDTLRSVRRLIRNKEILSDRVSPLERSELAIARAQAGQNVAILSSGHPGIFAIASTFFAYLKQTKTTIPVEVIPGLTLADYAAAKLGSPLGSDFAVISLADLATGWGDIKRRLVAALVADFVLVIYNPVGKIGGRRIREAIDVTSRYRVPATPAGLVSDAAGSLESVVITDLGRLCPGMITTNTLVIIGNSHSFVYDRRFITPRAYRQGLGY